MRYFRNIGITTVLLAIAFGVGILVAGGCKESTPPVATQTSGMPDLTKIVVAKVGEEEIPLSDLVYSLQVFMLLNKQLTGFVAIEQEAKKRGVYPTVEEQDKYFEDGLAQQGGREKFLAQFPPDLPPQIAFDALRDQSVMGPTQTALLKNEYETKHGAPTQDEITQNWTKNMTVFQDAVVAKNPDMKREDVTMEQAMDNIKQSIQDEWNAANAQTFFEGLIKSYTVTNYLLESYKATHPEETVVPLVGQPSAGDTGGLPPGATGGQ